MATPTRRDKMYKNLMAQNKRRNKENKTEEKQEPKDNEAINDLIKLWESKKKKNE
jgi:hypothetical protein